MPIALVILTALSSFMFGNRQVTPTPTPIDNKTNPTPAPPPTPIDPPTPVPVTDGPIADIAITDAAGKAINGLVGPNQQIIISGAKAVRGADPSSILIIIEPPCQQFTLPDGVTSIVTTPSAFQAIRIQEVVALGDKLASKTVVLQNGSFQLPDPEPQPKPDPPKPVPAKGKVSISFMSDPKNMDPNTSSVQESVVTWDAYHKAGNTYRIWSISNNDESGAVKTRSTLGSDVPGWVITDSAGNILVKGKLPTFGTERSTIQQFTGPL